MTEYLRNLQNSTIAFSVYTLLVILLFIHGKVQSLAVTISAEKSTQIINDGIGNMNADTTKNITASHPEYDNSINLLTRSSKYDTKNIIYNNSKIPLEHYSKSIIETNKNNTKSVNKNLTVKLKKWQLKSNSKRRKRSAKETNVRGKENIMSNSNGKVIKRTPQQNDRSQEKLNKNKDNQKTFADEREKTTEREESNDHIHNRQFMKRNPETSKQNEVGTENEEGDIKDREVNPQNFTYLIHDQGVDTKTRYGVDTGVDSYETKVKPDQDEDTGHAIQPGKSRNTHSTRETGQKIEEKENNLQDIRVDKSGSINGPRESHKDKISATYDYKMSQRKEEREYNKQDMDIGGGKNGPLERNKEHISATSDHKTSQLVTSTSSHILLDISISAYGVTLYVNNEQVYRSVNKTVQWGAAYNRYHAGIHLVVLQQTTGVLLTAETFTTWQLTSDAAFVTAFNAIQEGRLIAILGAPDFTGHLGTEATELLISLGADYAHTLAYKDIWCLLVHKGGRVVTEAIVSYFPGVRAPLPNPDVSPLTLHLAVPSISAPWCVWYNEPSLRAQREFCLQYSGYGDLCRCELPPWSPRPPQPPPQGKEVIPVALVTGGRFSRVLRQVEQVRASTGGSGTPITIFVDGDNVEAAALAHLINVTVIFNANNPAKKGHDSRVTYHIKFVLINVFRHYPEVDKAIIVEDDLELAPDFIEYFHQTSPLLTSDPRLLCVNAYNYNAFPHTATDPARLYRVDGLPAYGWMIRRKVALELLEDWPTVDQEVHWDLWIRARLLKGREVLIPEVPRTKHTGGGGVHVTGLEQALYHGRRIINTRANVTLDVQGAELDRYLKFHITNIDEGRVVRFTEHPCKVQPLPTTKVNESLVVYLYQPDETNDSSWAYYVVTRCLGLNDHNSHEHLKLMYTSSFYGNQLYIIGCPKSPFCLTKDDNDLYRPTQADKVYADNNPFRRVVVEKHIALRVPPTSPSELLRLDNIEDYFVTQV